MHLQLVEASTEAEIAQMSQCVPTLRLPERAVLEEYACSIYRETEFIGPKLNKTATETTNKQTLTPNVKLWVAGANHLKHGPSVDIRIVQHLLGGLQIVHAHRRRAAIEEAQYRRPVPASQLFGGAMQVIVVQRQNEEITSEYWDFWRT